MITPDEIRRKAERAYPRMLAVWARNDGTALFPLTIRANLAPVARNLSATVAAVEKLRANAKDKQGAGYTLHWKQIRSREFGNNAFPHRVTIDTLEDLLALSSRHRHFEATSRVADRIRRWRPALNEWVARNIRTIARLNEPLEGLIQVSEFFEGSPWPDCYARQIPVAVDTKFVERHRTVLREWLDELLPASAIQSDESKFTLRFGLRDGHPHTTVRILDETFQRELGLPYDEFSLPLRALANLPVQSATVVVVENRLNLLTLPPMQRAIAIRGEGKAVSRLARLPWLSVNRVLYWGDIDVEGFQILSNLRNFCPQAVSVMMNDAVLKRYSQFVVPGTDSPCKELTNLTDEEREAFRNCLLNNRRLEQERIDQAFVLEVLAAITLTGE